MLTTPEDEAHSGCDVTAAGARLDILRLEEGVKRESRVLCIETSQSGVARLTRGRHLPRLESIARAASGLGCAAAIVVEQKRPT